jgi:predicted O-linked N-acetylglucosamine transferase (SPINDLY family)
MAADGVDVLLDLSGHFPGNRLQVMARRAAPVQATYPNYPSTTGCPNLDYFFTDVWNSPPGTDDQYSESLYRLPGGCLRFEPPPAPDVTPRLPDGPVTFGLFQRAIKYSGSLWEMVAGTLEAVPDSRLLVHSSDLAWDVPGSGLLTRVRSQLEGKGVAPERVAFVGRRDMQDHLQVVGSVDIALDSYPYGGQTTTMECLWMGVPVVSRRGATHVSRVSGALLSRAGLDRLVADDSPGYVAAAAALAGDRDELQRLRSSLRSRVIDAGLIDGPRLCREMERAFEVWVARA